MRASVIGDGKALAAAHAALRGGDRSRSKQRKHPDRLLFTEPRLLHEKLFLRPCHSLYSGIFTVESVGPAIRGANDFD
ncbi:hypothetical protein L3V59_17640 [Burkholderia aenigmatica]|uniref:hypothetical protein n=1 Tax=Burkholderia cepacia complex TaxID=87882 RepID=UPI0013DDB928|nr:MULTISPECIES: hypothetical protein [Burkholderia cepacia complex]UKD11436.1 hypothetical protein L3V59_17640 [Burkholderia aenigmatica]